MQNTNRQKDDTETHQVKSQLSSKMICLAICILSIIITLFFYIFFSNQLEALSDFFSFYFALISAATGFFVWFGRGISRSEKTKMTVSAIGLGILIGGVLSIILPMEIVSPKTTVVEDYRSNSQPAYSQPIIQHSNDEEDKEETDTLPESQKQPSEPMDLGLETQELPSSSQDMSENIQPPLALTIPDEDESGKIERNVLSDIYTIMGETNLEEKIEITANNFSANMAYLKGIIDRLINTDVHPGDSEVNRDRDFTSLTTRANRLQNEIKENGVSIDKQIELISLREQAYDLHSTCGLRSLLAYDYAELARLQEHEKDYVQAYQNYIHAIEYDFLHIRALSQADDAYYTSVFNIAVWCAKIGTIADMSEGSKREAHYIAACLFRLALENHQSETFSDRWERCYKYTADEYHSLFILTRNTDRLQAISYFNMAFQLYQQSVDFSQYTKDVAENLTQLCDWAISYINKYGSAGEMLNRDEYKELRDKYYSLSISVD